MITSAQFVGDNRRSPYDLYSNPQTSFVAKFIGTTNLLEANKISNNQVEINGSTLECNETINENSVTITIRPEDIKINPDSSEKNIFQGAIKELEFLGSHFRGLVEVDEYYRTNVAGIHAIGDIVKGPALAHVASAEGITCVEAIKGMNPETIDYNNIPGCTYCSPEVASVGYTEEAAKAAGYEIKVGKFPFTASGKAKAAGVSEGFVKVIFDAKYGEFLGAHMIGANVTEMIAEAVVARKLETTAHEILNAIHPHPTMSEGLKEATAAAYGEAIDI